MAFQQDKLSRERSGEVQYETQYEERTSQVELLSSKQIGVLKVPDTQQI